MKIYIINTGSANLNSVYQAFKRLGYEATISNDVEQMKDADRLVLPGVGAAISAMNGLRDNKLVDFVLNNQKPLLGICLGMQIQATDSTEVPLESNAKTIDCLGIVKNHVANLPENTDLRMPHMGWNTVHHTDHPLFDGIKQDSFFYFDHSFAMDLSEDTIGVTDYGTKFSSAIAHNNFMGVQFHPEKSSANGEKLLTNFIQNF